MKHGFDLFRDSYGTGSMRRVWAESNMVQKWLDVEAAIAAAQKDLGVLPPGVADRIMACCSVERVPPSLIAEHRERVGHLMVATMHAFAEVCGPEGEMFHLGATTQDIFDTGLALQVREACHLIRQSLDRLDQTLLDLAERHRDTVMMGRTHAQHATPLTFGFKVAVWASELADHAARLGACSGRLSYANLSGAVGSNASYQFLFGAEKTARFRELVAARLDLEAPSLDLHQRTDRFAELVHVLSMIGTTLGRVGLEIRELQRPEIGELAEPLTFDRQYASSTMPNKRNPSLCEWQEALAKLLRANASAIGEVAMQHERDATWLGVEMAVIPESFLLCASALNMANKVFGGLVVHPDRMERNLYLQHGVAMAEAAMLRLYQSKGGKLDAHRICHEAAMQALEERRPLGETLLEHAEVKGILDPAALENALDPLAYTGNCAAQVDAYLSARCGGQQKN
jgi:adenylosuccinate lyase